MNLVKKLIADNRYSFLLLVVTSVVNGGLNAAFLALVTYNLAHPEMHSVKGILLFSAACLGILLIRVLHRYIAVVVANRTGNQLRLRLGRLVASSSANAVERHGNAKLLTVLTADVGTITGFILTVPAMLGSLTFLLGAMIYLAYLSGPGLFVGMVAVVTLLMVLYGRVMAASRVHFQRVREEAEVMMGYQTDLVNGYKELKMDAGVADKLIDGCMRSSNRRLARAQLNAGLRHAVGLVSGTGLVYALVGVVLFVFPVLLGYPAEVVMGYVLAIIAAANPLQSVIEFYPTIIRTRISADKISMLRGQLEKTQENSGNGSADCATLSFSRIDLSGATFSYEEENTALNALGPFDVTLRRGEVLFLSGGNGSGKTTLAKMLCGLYSPQSGTLALDGRPISDDLMRHYRQHFSTVYSDFHILKNSPQIYDLRHLSRHPLAEEFGLDESQYLRGGVISSDQLSQGQRRRLAILMAVDADKPIYLFDEPGSDLDPDFKRFFYGTVLGYLKQKGASVVVVTHDDNYFGYADRRLVLRDGRIVSGEDAGIHPGKAKLEAGISEVG